MMQNLIFKFEEHSLIQEGNFQKEVEVKSFGHKEIGRDTLTLRDLFIIENVYDRNDPPQKIGEKVTGLNESLNISFIRMRKSVPERLSRKVQVTKTWNDPKDDNIKHAYVVFEMMDIRYHGKIALKLDKSDLNRERVNEISFFLNKGVTFRDR